MALDRMISALVIGESGVGKSEFILSFIDEEQRKKLPVSGVGQTTRTSMTYSIHCDSVLRGLHAIFVTLKTEDDFVDERIRKLKAFLDDLTSPPNEENRDYLKNTLLHDDAFFNINEFGAAENEIEELFANSFPDEFWANMPTNSDDDDDPDGFEIDDRPFREFFKKVYKICFNVMAESDKDVDFKRDSFDIYDKDVEYIARFMKKGENTLSYSSLVKSVGVHAYICSEYKSVMDDNNISVIQLIDTYGLDHETSPSNDEVQRIYEKLLLNDYPDVKAAFYLRKFGGSPADLRQNLPLLLKTKPVVMPYAIFTRVDERWDEYENDKAFTSFKNVPNNEFISRLKHAFKDAENLTKEMRDRRIGELCDTVSVYSSRPEKAPDEYKEAILKKNKETVAAIFSSIRYKKYIGENYISVNGMHDPIFYPIYRPEENFFTTHWWDDIPGGTIREAWKNFAYYNALGYGSPTRSGTSWSEFYLEDIGAFEGTVMKLLSGGKIKEHLSKAGVEAEEFQNIISVFFERLKQHIYGLWWVDQLNDSYYSHRIIRALYEDRKDTIKEGPGDFKGSRKVYLNNVCHFKGIRPEAFDNIKKIMTDAYAVTYIEFARKYNAAIIARKAENLRESEKNSILEEYYANYDSMNDDEKIEFEMMVEERIGK